MVIIDAMAVVQAMGKPPRVRNGRDLASHIIEVIDSKKRTGTSRAVVYKITVDAVINKITRKDLLRCSQNKETLAIFLSAQLIECIKKLEGNVCGNL